MAEYKPTAEQTAILAHDTSKSARVLAGPGTGKSATMVALLQKLLSKTEQPPRVKLLTFTRAATAELAAKVGRGDENSTIHRPSTIHSFAISVLLQNPGTGGFPEPLRIADDWERRHIVLETLKRRSGFRLKELERLEREMAANWESLAPEEDPEVSAEDRARYQGVWQEHRRVYGYTLLSELPFALRRAMEAHDDLDGLDFDLLVVDEYQDLNACDLEILKRAQDKGCALLAAGDDDQSIYSFRKARPEGIRRFVHDYPDACDYSLSVTLRCGKQIITWANHVIAGDPTRPDDKPLLTPLSDSPDGEVAHLKFRGNVSESKGVADLVAKLCDVDKLKPSEILVLLRSDHGGGYSKPIRAELEGRGIPCSDPGAIHELLEKPDNRRFIALLRLLFDRDDSLAWATLAFLERGLKTDAFADYVYALATPGNTFASALFVASKAGFPDAPGRTGTVAEGLLARVVPWLDANTPDSIPPEGWAAWAANVASSSLYPPPTPELVTLLHDVEELAETDQTLGQLLGQLYPIGRDLAQSRSDGVRIMSMSASKGLTVRATIIAGLDDVVMPRDDEDQSEARRLLYVAMTRSKEYLYVTWAARRKGPTARAGSESLARRLPCPFLDSGPVSTEDGPAFLRTRWP